MWLLVLLFVCIGSSQGHPCPSRRNAIKFSITSEKNATGHWNAQLLMKHSAGLNESGPWVVDMEHITEQYEHLYNIEIRSNVSAPMMMPITRNAPGPDYELIPRLGYYKFHPEPKTWFEARTICQHEGAHLVIINSQREANALLHFWVPYPKIFTDWRNEWAHIGFHDQYVEGEYVTIYGDLLKSTGYQKWLPSQPNTGVHENCGVADRTASLLADVGCSAELPFFCEQEA